MEDVIDASRTKQFKRRGPVYGYGYNYVYGYSYVYGLLTMLVLSGIR